MEAVFGCRVDFLVAMTDARCDNVGEHVQIAFAFRVQEPLFVIVNVDLDVISVCLNNRRTILLKGGFGVFSEFLRMRAP